MNRPNGVVLWESDDVVAIATGLARPSANPKTGPMVQTWILNARRPPHEPGAERAVCGDGARRCPLADGACYVARWQGPLSVWKAWQRGAYGRAWDAETFRGRSVRLGAYGDPAVVPVRVWERVTRHAERWTGYTHQWRWLRSARWQRLIMASADDLETRELAQSRGWRTFTVVPKGSERPDGDVWCPASPEGGFRSTCHRCGLCAGTSANAASVSIQAHGSGAGKLPVLQA